MLSSIEWKISSNYVTIINFLIFDVTLISLLYLLTEDVMGRLNDWTLRDGNPHRLFIACPPLLGGGLCTTSRVRAHLMFLIRFLGLGLILMSTLCIQGESRAEIFKVNGNVLTHGNISYVNDPETFNEKVFLRSTCQGSRVEGNRTIIHHGELRQARKKQGLTLECVIDRDLLTGLRFEYDPRVLSLNVTTGRGCTSKRLTDKRGDSIAVYFCPYATLICLFDPGAVQPNRNTCRGVLRHDGEMYLCEEGAAFPDMFPREPTEMHWARGIAVNDTFWLEAAVHVASLQDVIDASSVAYMERRLVKKKRNVDWTVINPLWFAVLALKVLLVLVLAVSALFLKKSGYHPVVHDEGCLFGLLYKMIEERTWPERRKTGLEDHSIFLNVHQSAAGPVIIADIHPRMPVLSSKPTLYV